MNKKQRGVYLADLANRLRLPMPHESLVFTPKGKPRSPSSLNRVVAWNFVNENQDRWESSLALKLIGLFVPHQILNDPNRQHVYIAANFDGEDLDSLYSTHWSTRKNWWRKRVSPLTGEEYPLSAAPAVPQPQNWLRLFTGRYALGTNWDLGETRSALLVDIDSHDWGFSLLDAPAEFRMVLLNYLQSAWTEMHNQVEIAPLKVHWMASGGGGLWLHVFLEDPIPVEALEQTFQSFKDITGEVLEGIGMVFDKTNLVDQGCRLPFSRHSGTGHYACYLDPTTGEPFQDQHQYIMGISGNSTERALAFADCAKGSCFDAVLSAAETRDLVSLLLTYLGRDNREDKTGLDGGYTGSREANALVYPSYLIDEAGEVGSELREAEESSETGVAETKAARLREVKISQELESLAVKPPRPPIHCVRSLPWEELASKTPEIRQELENSAHYSHLTTVFDIVNQFHQLKEDEHGEGDGEPPCTTPFAADRGPSKIRNIELSANRVFDLRRGNRWLALQAGAADQSIRSLVRRGWRTEEIDHGDILSNVPGLEWDGEDLREWAPMLDSKLRWARQHGLAKSCLIDAPDVEWCAHQAHRMALDFRSLLPKQNRATVEDMFRLLLVLLYDSLTWGEQFYVSYRALLVQTGQYPRTVTDAEFNDKDVNAVFERVQKLIVRSPKCLMPMLTLVESGDLRRANLYEIDWSWMKEKYGEQPPFHQLHPVAARGEGLQSGEGPNAQVSLPSPGSDGRGLERSIAPMSGSSGSDAKAGAAAMSAQDSTPAPAPAPIQAGTSDLSGVF